MIPAIGPLDWALVGAAVANHLWQSTLFVGPAWLLTLALRKSHAGVRHWIWMTASLKFLLPFSLLIALGGHLASQTAPAIAPPQWSVVENISQPFTGPVFMPTEPVATPPTRSPIKPWLVVAAWFAGFAAVGLYGVARWRRLTALLGQTRPLSEGREVEALRRLQLLGNGPSQVNLATSVSTIEPGVRGIIHPVLLLPVGIAKRLDDEQLEAIIAHELSHIRRRDNLAAAIHMGAEMIFWFHPLVWWIGSRLVTEREHACDEDVLRLGSDPQVYAGAILKVCGFYLASPLAVLSGVTGSNLKRRIENIMSKRVGIRLNMAEKALLAIAGIAAISVPLLLGSTHPAQANTQPLEFEVVSVKPNVSGNTALTLDFPPGGRLTVTNSTLKLLIATAYRIQAFQLSGGPSWLDSARYDISAKAAQTDASSSQIREMLKTLLADRFQLRFHHETKDLPVYKLVVDKNGTKLQPSKAGADDPRNGVRVGRGQMTAQSISLSILSQALANQLGRPVLDQTNLSGNFDFKLEWTPDIGEAQGPKDRAAPPASSDSSLSPSIFTAIQEQMGLRLESTREPVEILVIDHAEKPTEKDAAIGAKVNPVFPAEAPPIVPAGARPGILSTISSRRIQAPSSVVAPLAFEVASIKPDKAGNLPSPFGLAAVPQGVPTGCHGTDRGPQSVPLGRCVFQNITVGALFATFFNQSSDKIADVPSWVTSDGFDVEAKAAEPATQQELILMMQTLLADRFKLKFHLETREVTGFALLVAPGGAKLKEAAEDETNSGISMSSSQGFLRGRKASMTRLALFLSGGLGRTVSDSTGLGGNYDFALNWTPEAVANTGAAAGPSIFTALQEQLGLRLESRKLSVEFALIDHVEKPTN